MNWYLTVIKNYATFSGRARRKEYWMFYLINMIISLSINAITANQAGLSIVGSIYSLALLVPSIAVGVRRMHDVNKSGWFLLIPIYNIVLLATNGDSGTNEYGNDPKGDNSTFVKNNDLLDDQMIN